MTSNLRSILTLCSFCLMVGGRIWETARRTPLHRALPSLDTTDFDSELREQDCSIVKNM